MFATNFTVSPNDFFRGYRVVISESLLLRVRSIPKASMLPAPHEDSIAARLHDLLQVPAGLYKLLPPWRFGGQSMIPCEIMVPIFSDNTIEYMTIVHPAFKAATLVTLDFEARFPLVPFPIEELDWKDTSLKAFSAAEARRIRSVGADFRR